MINHRGRSSTRALGGVATAAPEPAFADTRPSGADLLCEALAQQGVDVVFGYPGGAVLPVYDALYRARVRHILTRHEQGAVHAAQGYARVTGKPGVVIATSGPGATNLVTGIADAYMDSTPLVVVTGQVVTDKIGTDSFQEVDILGITTPITKYSAQVRRAQDIPQAVATAFHIAVTGRPGPVLLDLPKDVSAARPESRDARDSAGPRHWGTDPSPGTAPGGAPPAVESPPLGEPGYKLPAPPKHDSLDAISAAVRQARRPLLLVGGGVVIAGASGLLREFAARESIPVCCTLMGLGAFPAGDPLFVGMVGMHGTYAANRAVTECDLLIAIGVRFSDRVMGNPQRFAPRAMKIHVDIDAAEIGKNVPVDLPLLADAGDALRGLLLRRAAPRTEEWLTAIGRWQAEHPLPDIETGSLAPQTVIRLLNAATRGQAIVATDVGQHQIWTAHLYPQSEPRRWVTSGGLGTMGFGVPAALGAQIGAPGSLVLCVTGDGSVQMNVQEFQTIVEHQLPVKICVLRNGYLGMVRQWQQFFHGRRYAESEISSPDFVRLASAYGMLGLRAANPAEARVAIDAALSHRGPVVIDFVVTAEENVYPMVPSGKGNDEMVLSD